MLCDRRQLHMLVLEQRAAVQTDRIVVELDVGVLFDPEDPSLQRNAREQALGAGHHHDPVLQFVVRARSRAAAQLSRRVAGVGADRELPAGNCLNGLRVLEHDQELRHRHTELQSQAAAGEANEGRPAPASRFKTCGQHAAAMLHSAQEPHRNKFRKDRHGMGVFKDAGDFFFERPADFLQDRCGVHHPVVELLVGDHGRREQKESDSNNCCTHHRCLKGGVVGSANIHYFMGLSMNFVSHFKQFHGRGDWI